MELKDLVGSHILTGVDSEVEKNNENLYDEDATVFYFVLDGVTYKATEDPSDGYRSHLGNIEVVDAKVKNTFEPVKVLAIMKPDGGYQTNDTLQLYDVQNGKLILEVGTDNTDDWYPSFVGWFSPEDMSINSGK